MAHYIDKAALVAEIEKLKGKVSDDSSYCNGWQHALRMLEIELNTLEVKDPYEQCIQYDSIKAGIQAHAETYSFNIESHLFPQLTKEQQALWRKEIEQACISGGDMGYSLAKDPRYKENLEVKEVDLENPPQPKHSCFMYICGIEPMWKVGDILAEYEFYSDREGELVHGEIEKVEYDEVNEDWCYTFKEGAVIVEEELISNEAYKKNT